MQVACGGVGGQVGEAIGAAPSNVDGEHVGDVIVENAARQFAATTAANNGGGELIAAEQADTGSALQVKQDDAGLSVSHQSHEAGGEKDLFHKFVGWGFLNWDRWFPEWFQIVNRSVPEFWGVRRAFDWQ